MLFDQAIKTTNCIRVFSYTVSVINGLSTKHLIWFLQFQGVPGAYSELAAKRVYPSCEPVPCEQFETTFEVHSHALFFLTYFEFNSVNFSPV